MQEKNEKEIQQFCNRLRDLANRSFQQNLFTFTDFLGLSEQELFWRQVPELRGISYKLWGGRDQADRVMVRFGDPKDFGYDTLFPIVCIHIRPVNEKFADALSHRDFLGALMNLGIERSTLGDIIVGEKQAYLFCQDTIADFICENLEQVKHTKVVCRKTEDFRELPAPEPSKELLQLQSLRADALVAKVYKLSREESLTLFRAGRVFVDGRLCENNSRIVKPGETVNARGFGKFVLLEEKGETRKGKTNVEVAVYR